MSGINRHNAKLYVGPGWSGLVNRAYDEKPKNVSVLQVKEKFGGLRICTGGAPGWYHDLLSELQNDSYTICEACGNPGHPRDELPWIRTLCDDCLAIMKTGGSPFGVHEKKRLQEMLGKTSKKVLQLIIEYKKDHDGVAPSYSEIAEEMGLAPSNVHYHIQILKDVGLIIVPDKIARNIQVVGGRWIGPAEVKDDNSQ